MVGHGRHIPEPIGDGAAPANGVGADDPVTRRVIGEVQHPPQAVGDLGQVSVGVGEGVGVAPSLGDSVEVPQGVELVGELAAG